MNCHHRLPALTMSSGIQLAAWYNDLDRITVRSDHHTLSLYVADGYERCNRDERKRDRREYPRCFHRPLASDKNGPARRHSLRGTVELNSGIQLAAWYNDLDRITVRSDHHTLSPTKERSPRISQVLSSPFGIRQKRSGPPPFFQPYGVFW
jgi:hypothetical protein